MKTFIAILVFALAAPLVAQTRGERPSSCTGIVFNPDGTKMMAGYFTPAMNEPGTDWRAFVVQWDLKQGTRKVIKRACWPAKFGEGDTVEMGFYEPAKRPMMKPDAKAAIWKFSEEKPQRVLDEMSNILAPDGFSPDRSLSAKSEKGKVSILDKTGKQLKQFLAGGGAVAWQPDGKAIAIADMIGAIRFWDVESGKLLRTLRPEGDETNTVRVAAVQFRSEFLDPERNRRELKSNVAAAARYGAQIVVLPETAVQGYMSNDLKQTWRAKGRDVTEGLEGVDVKRVAETVPGKSTQYFSAVAAEHGIYLTVPLVEIDSKSGKFFNSVVVLDPNGEIAIHYRKKNPWDWAEHGWSSDGDLGNPVIDTPWGRLSTIVCFDIHKEASVVRDLKVDMLLYCIAWVEDEGSDWFAKKLPAIAKENHLAIIGANWTVAQQAKPAWHGFGHSEIITADGKIAAKAQLDNCDEIVFADLPVETK